ncbi:MAG: hypothetical protein AABY16_04765 [Nanoarchaeota archaeon]
MKIFIAGSRKFHNEIQNMCKELNKKGIKASTAGEWNPKEKDTFQSEKKALLKAFNKIDNSNIVYIYAKDGYVGKTVAMEIAYAYAKNKRIISSEEIKEFSAKALISKAQSHDKLIKNFNIKADF